MTINLSISPLSRRGKDFYLENGCLWNMFKIGRKNVVWGTLREFYRKVLGILDLW